MSAWITLDSRSKQHVEARARQIQRLLEKSRAFSLWPAALRYAVTALLVAISFLLCLVSEGVSSYPLFVFMPAIIVASFLFDRRAGYFAAILSTLVALSLLMDVGLPSFPQEAGTIVALVAFTFVGLFTAYVIEALRITIDVLAENAALREQKRELENELVHAQKMEAVGRAKSILAHDFKNVLTPVVSAVHVLRKRLPAADDLAELLDVLDNACQHGTRLADDIRSFGRKERADCLAVNVNKALDEALPAIRQSLRPTISLQLDLAEGLPEALLDPALFERALANIIDNAADAMPAGGTIAIATSLRRLPATEFPGFGRCAAGDYLCFTVTDTGTGMPPDVKARIFEPFYTTKPSGQGTGLGMAMVADFVRHAQGWVAVDSEPGAGTAIRLFLPVPGPAARRPMMERAPMRGAALASGA